MTLKLELATYKIHPHDGDDIVPQGTNHIFIEYRDGKPFKVTYAGMNIGPEGLSSLKETWDEGEINKLIDIIHP